MGVSRYLELSSFNEIELNSTFDVFLIEDTSYSIIIIGNEKNIENMVCKVENNVLMISNKKSYKWLTPKDNKITIYINSKQLKKVSANQTCNIKTLNPITSEEFGLIFGSKTNEATLELDCNAFYFWNNFPSGGKLILSGKTDYLSIWNDALMSVDAKSVIAENALVENKSKGDCEVTVLGRLEYSINGIGNIHLYGSPQEVIKIQLTSTGRLIQH